MLQFDGQFDWIQLTSGEWLKGEFQSMYDDSVEFDSDVLGLLEIDWGDVNAVDLVQPMSIRTDDRKVRREAVVMEEQKVAFAQSNATADRDEIVAIVPMATSEWDHWKLEAKIGFDFQRGNTQETRVTGNVSAERRSATTRLFLSYLGNYTTTDDVETTNNHRLSTTFDYFFSDRIFVRAFDGEYLRDPFQNIDFQMTLGAGIGYQVLDTGSTDWEVLAGPAYQYTLFSTVQPGQDKTAQSPAASLQSTFNTDITDDLELALTYQAIFTDRKSGLLTQHVVTSLDYELTSIFDVFIMLQLDRVEAPTARSDGSVPDKNDVTLSFGLGVDL